MRHVITILAAISFLSFVNYAKSEMASREKIHVVCAANLPSSRSECDGLISSLNSIESPDSSTWFSLAEAYLGLAHWMQREGESNYNDFRALARSAYEEALRADSNSLEALYALSVLGHKEKRIGYYKRMLEIDHENLKALKSLSKVYSRSNNTDDQVAAFGYLQKGYEVTEKSERLDFAQSIYTTYLQKNLPGEAVVFRNRVLSDFGIKPPSLDDGVSTESLVSSCHSKLLRIFNTENLCLEAIRSTFKGDLVMPAIEDGKRDILVEAMGNLIQYGFVGQVEKRSNIKAEFLTLFPRLERSSNSSLEFYLAYASILDGQKRIDALKSATQSDVVFRKNKGWFKMQAHFLLAKAFQNSVRNQEAEALYELVSRGKYTSLARRAKAELENIRKEVD